MNKIQQFMKDNLEIINSTFEKIMPKDTRGTFWGGLWAFLSLLATLLFAAFYLLFLNPLGWVSLVILSLLYKFIRYAKEIQVGN